MIRSIEHGRRSIRSLQQSNQRSQKAVRIAYGVIIGIHQVLPVFVFGIRQAIRFKDCHRFGITLLVVKMRTIGMQHNKQFAMSCLQLLFHQCQ